MQPRTTALLSLALLACPACAFEEEDYDDLEPRETNVSGGTVFNTHLVEARALSELAQPMGAPREGAVLESVTLAGQSFVVHHFDIVDGEIVVFNAWGGSRRGAQLVGSEWKLSLPSTDLTVMRISDYTVIDEVPHYVFEHQWQGAWRNNCAPSAMSKGTEKYYARMLTGFAPNPQVVGDVQPAEKTTFIACNNGAVGKAAMWGYYDLALLENESGGPVEIIKEVPGDSDGLDPVLPVEFSGAIEAIAADQGSHAPVVVDPLQQLELAIRVVRADYCYDGKSATTVGAAIDIEDIWGINERPAGAAGAAELTIEAVWGADKLLCAGQGRKTTTIDCGPLNPIPPCDSETTLATYTGALIMTRIP